MQQPDALPLIARPLSPCRFLSVSSSIPALPRGKVKGRVSADLGLHEIVSSRGNKSRAAMFALLVTEVLDDWPEKHRNRKLVRATGGGPTARCSVARQSSVGSQ